MNSEKEKIQDAKHKAIHDNKSITAVKDAYIGAVVPVGAGSVQVQETSRAFMAGAQSMFLLLLGYSDFPEDVAAEMLSSTEDELNAFSKLVKDGKA